MDRLWAPWRSRLFYQRGAKGCIFCRAVRSRADRRHLVVRRSRHAFAMLNLYPYNNGHVMVAPFRHVRSLEYLSIEELTDLMELVKRTKLLLDSKLKPEGYNIGLNIGRVSGAGYDGHIHIHIVPRWSGDTNFMPILTDSKIVSESLDAVYKLLKS